MTDWRWVRVGRFEVGWRLELKWQDAWVGAFWKAADNPILSQTEIWVCVIPCLPIHLKAWRWTR